jgi:hypothetical protein
MRPKWGFPRRLDAPVPPEKTGNSSVGTKSKAKPAGHKPVSAHPMFPAIVALWFAALLGIGCLVLPQALYDKLGVTLGLGALGLSARGTVALIAGALGGALGMFLARKATGGAGHVAPRRAKAHSALTPAKRPISALEELGSDGLDEPVADAGPEPFNGRRRALAVTDESGPSEYLTHVPLPGGNDALDLIGADLAFEVSGDLPDEDDALDLHTFAEEPSPEENPASYTPAVSADPAPFARAATATAMEERQMFRPADPAQAPLFGRSDADWTPEPVSAHEAVGAGTSAAETPEFAPRPFAPPAAAMPAATAAPFSMPFAAPTQSFDPAPAAEPEAVLAPGSAEADLAAAARPVFAPFGAPHIVEDAVSGQQPAPATAAISDQALVGLIDRFAEALRRADPASAGAHVATGLRRFAPEMVAATALTPAFAQSALAEDQASEMAEVASSDPTPGESAPPFSPPFALPFAMPAALQPVGVDDHDDGDDSEDDYAHRFALPIKPADKPFAQPMPSSTSASPAFGMPQEAAPAADDPARETVQGAGFGSLLAMKGGFGPGRDFVRIEDTDDDEPGQGIEPVVVFPGAAGQSQTAASAPFTSPAPFAPSPFAQAQAAASPLDRQATEQALREALAKLQQMSGAA